MPPLAKNKYSTPYPCKYGYKMKDLRHEKRPDCRQALTFTVEDKSFETFDQYKTGAELKQLAGIPKETELFLAVHEGYEPNLIGNDEKVDLARTDLEYFFVKDKLKFFVNGDQFISYQQYIKGHVIRELGKIPAEDELFLKVPEPYEDEVIEDDRKVDLVLPGKEHFISKPFKVTILVNTRRKLWEKRTITFEEVVILAFDSYDPNPQKVYTVNYSGGVEPKLEGSMVKGSVVYVKNKMNFDVSATNQS